MVKDHSDSERGEETRCHHMGYSFWLATRVLLYAPYHRQDGTYHSLWYTSHGALAGTRNSSMGPSWRIDPTTQRTISECSYHRATSRSQSVSMSHDGFSHIANWSRCTVQGGWSDKVLSSACKSCIYILVIWRCIQHINIFISVEITLREITPVIHWWGLISEWLITGLWLCHKYILSDKNVSSMFIKQMMIICIQWTINSLFQSFSIFECSLLAAN